MSRAPSLSAFSLGSASVGSTFVAEAALAALHAEMVVYVVQHNAQKRAQAELRTLEMSSVRRDDDASWTDEGEDDKDDSASCASTAEGGSDAAGGDLRTSVSGECSNPRGGADAGNGIISSAEYILEAMGIHTGMRITERLLHREPLVRYTPLEITRFVGSHLWRAIFGKKVDKMKHLDNIYFSLQETNFSWSRCSTQSAAPAGAKSGSIISGSTAGGAAAAGSAIVATGYGEDGTPLDAEAALRAARLAAERAGRQQPTTKDMLLFMQGVLRGVVELLMGAGYPVIVVTQAVGLSDAQFVLDFRQCPKAG